MRPLDVSRIFATLIMAAITACTANVPGQLIPSTSPIDEARRVNLVGKEAIGESCQWWISANAKLGAVLFPIPVEGNQNYLALADALGEEYDGLVDAAADQRITPWGIAIPTSSNPLEWVHVFLIENCQEIRGKPFVYVSSPFRPE